MNNGCDGGGRSGFYVGIDPEEYRRQEWLMRAAAGDQAAFEQLYRAFAGKVYSYLRIRVMYDADVDDLLQDVFLTLWRSSRQYKGHSSVAT
ncbi:MAG: hypothetical protein K6T83_22780 [Alicyclobacillus sp.]|nr:hypothetical protein [Alicyclobacillus sp.]